MKLLALLLCELREQWQHWDRIHGLKFVISSGTQKNGIYLEGGSEDQEELF